MAEMSEWEVRQIQEAISRVEKKVKEITTKLTNNNYDSQIDRAHQKLRTYSQMESNALKVAEKAIEKAFSGSGFLFSREGFNAIMQKKSEESSRQISSILNDYSEDVSKIMQALPTIGSPARHYAIFDTTEYSGDKEYGVFSDFPSGDTDGGGIDIVFGIDDDVAMADISLEDTVGYAPPKQEGVETITFDTPIETAEYTTPDNLTVMQIGMISNATVKKLICKNVVELQANAFKGIEGLELVVLCSAIKTININAFRGLENKCIIAFEGDKDTVLRTISTPESLNNRKVIFGYNAGDENLGKVEVFTTAASTKPEKSKRVVIKADTPLDNDSIKQTFIQRNAKYGITMDELNAGILAAKSNTNKDLILFETLKLVLKRNLAEVSYWNYAETLQGIVKYSKGLGLLDEELYAIFGLFFLDSSGYRMVNGRYNPYKQVPDQMYYHPKMQMNDLYEIQHTTPLSNDELAAKYRQSPYVIELSKAIKDAYYTVENSIKMMLMAMSNPDYIFYPAKSGVGKR